MEYIYSILALFLIALGFVAAYYAVCIFLAAIIYSKEFKYYITAQFTILKIHLVGHYDDSYYGLVSLFNKQFVVRVPYVNSLTNYVNLLDTDDIYYYEVKDKINLSETKLFFAICDLINTKYLMKRHITNHLIKKQSEFKNIKELESALEIANRKIIIDKMLRNI